MNVDTGELMRMREGVSHEEKAQLFAKGFYEVPKNLEEAANKELADNQRAMVNMRRNTPLTAWAKRVKQGRNEKCSCGSGRKYKVCCGKVI